MHRHRLGLPDRSSTAVTAAALFAVGMSLTTHAGVPQSPSPTLPAIGGRVVEGTTGAPLSGVAVAMRCGSIVSTSPNEVLVGSGQSATTGTNGEFRVAASDGSPCQIYGARLAGYSTDWRETMRPMELGAGDVFHELHLWPLVTIDGRVTDEAGRAVAGTPVYLQRRDLEGGIARWSQPYASAPVATDSQGRFQFPAVQTGATYRAIAPFVEPTTPAASIALSHGDSGAEVELRGRVLPRFTITGRLADDAGPATGLFVRLESAADDGTSLVLDEQTTRATGAFVFAVAEGQYRIRVNTTPPQPGPSSSPIRWADVAVDVRGNVDGLVVSLRRGAVARGVVQLDEGDGSLRAATGALLRLSPALGGPGGRMARTMDGDFSIGEVMPGRYFFRPTGIPQGFRMKSVTVSGRDITTTGLDLIGSVDDVRVTLTNEIGGLTGRVRDTDGEPYGLASVLVFPEDERQWRDAGTILQRVQIRPATHLGNFTIGYLVAGDYLVAAIPSDQLETPLAHDANLLARLAPLATRVRVDAHAVTNLDLDVVRRASVPARP